MDHPADSYPPYIALSWTTLHCNFPNTKVNTDLLKEQLSCGKARMDGMNLRIKGSKTRDIIVKVHEHSTINHL